MARPRGHFRKRDENDAEKALARAQRAESIAAAQKARLGGVR
jgi:hypothetical protein